MADYDTDATWTVGCAILWYSNHGDRGFDTCGTLARRRGPPASLAPWSWHHAPARSRTGISCRPNWSLQCPSCRCALCGSPLLCSDRLHRWGFAYQASDYRLATKCPRDWEKPCLRSQIPTHPSRYLCLGSRAKPLSAGRTPSCTGTEASTTSLDCGGSVKNINCGSLVARICWSEHVSQRLVARSHFDCLLDWCQNRIHHGGPTFRLERCWLDSHFEAYQEWPIHGVSLAPAGRWCDTVYLRSPGGSALLLAAHEMVALSCVSTNCGKGRGSGTEVWIGQFVSPAPADLSELLLGCRSIHCSAAGRSFLGPHHTESLYRPQNRHAASQDSRRCASGAEHPSRTAIEAIWIAWPRQGGQGWSLPPRRPRLGPAGANPLCWAYWFFPLRGRASMGPTWAALPVHPGDRPRRSSMLYLPVWQQVRNLLGHLDGCDKGKPHDPKTQTTRSEDLQRPSRRKVNSIARKSRLKCRRDSQSFGDFAQSRLSLGIRPERTQTSLFPRTGQTVGCQKPEISTARKINEQFGQYPIDQIVQSAIIPLGTLEVRWISQLISPGEPGSSVPPAEPSPGLFVS